MENINKIKLPSKTHILAVSKKQSIEKIKDLHLQGQKLFGENYVQEALPKIEALKEFDIEWHFIGSLQKNKVKFVVGVFDLIHSVDSVDLAEKIGIEALKKQTTQKILLQVNIAREGSKGGFSVEQLPVAVEKIAHFSGVQVVGLMTMPPLQDDPEKNRGHFKRLRQLMEKMQTRWPDIKVLSMGTSTDYAVAAEEGATLVRLGTLLFGPRQ